MHNRKKVDKSNIKAPTEAELLLAKKKRNALSTTINSILEQKKWLCVASPTDNIDMKSLVDGLALTAKIIRVNPDFYSLWNFRREILQRQYSEIISGKSTCSDIRDAELQLSQDGIQKNPKSYCAWHHRIWISQHFSIDYAKELELCKEFLKLDQRNFHCWNYRRYLVQYIGECNGKQFELDFSTEKIQENFSNYSAFHHRSVYIKDIVSEDSFEKILEAEFNIIESAVYTDPYDQSAWWYMQFLLVWASSFVKTQKNQASASLWLYELLRRQETVLKSLLEVEKKSKWAMIALLLLVDVFLDDDLCLYRNFISCGKHKDKSSTTQSTEDMYMQWKEEKCSLLEELIRIDSLHANRYKYLLQNIQP